MRQAKTLKEIQMKFKVTCYERNTWVAEVEATDLEDAVAKAEERYEGDGFNGFREASSPDGWRWESTPKDPEVS